MGFSGRSPLLIAGSLAGLVALSGCSGEASAQRTPLEGDVTAALDPRTDRLADAIAEESGPEGSVEGEAPLLDENGDPIFGVEIPLFDPSGTALRSFHAALRRAAMGEGQARVVVYGASHVAGDFATGTLRRLLQRQFGDAGHGFVMPAHPWPHYRHLDITVESNHRLWEAQRIRASSTEVGRYGLAGVSVTATSSRAYGRVIARSASRFELFYLRQPQGGSLEVRIDDRVVGRVRTRSSGTDGEDAYRPDYALYTVPDGPHTLEIRPRGDGPVTIFGVAVEREVPGVVIDTLGINGARAAAQLLWDEAIWSEHVRRRNPDLLVLAYGTNESGDDDQPIEIYERDLRRVVTRARATVPNASCLLIGPSDRPVAHRDGTFSERPRTAQVVDTQRRVAAELGCGFFDLVSFGGGPMHMVQWAALQPAWAQRDHVHYTLRGYRRLGEVLHGALLRGYDGPTLPEAVVATSR